MVQFSKRPIPYLPLTPRKRGKGKTRERRGYKAADPSGHKKYLASLGGVRGEGEKVRGGRWIASGEGREGRRNGTKTKGLVPSELVNRQKVGSLLVSRGE